MSNKITAIYLAPHAGEAMGSVGSVMAIADTGLEGDRYATGEGYFSNSTRRTIRHVSFIGMEAIQQANTSAGTSFLPHLTRRNILTEGIELNDLVGEQFFIGGVALRGVELCTPCVRPSKLSGKPGFASAFQNLGGIRAEILTSGLIIVGQSIDLP